MYMQGLVHHNLLSNFSYNPVVSVARQATLFTSRVEVFTT